MSDDFNIKITGNWDFDNKKEIPEDETTKKAIDGLKDAFGNSETGKTLANMFKDGKINNKEAELVMMEFEDEGILGLDDFTVEGKEIEKFLKSKGVSDENLEAAAKNIQTVVSQIANTYQEANKTSSIKENYKAVTDIFTTDGKTQTLKPGADNDVQTVMYDKDITGPQKKTIVDLIQDGYNFGDTFSVKDFPQFYEQDEKGNVVYRDENGEVTTDKTKGNPTFNFDAIDDNIAHNIIDEYLQINDNLAAQLVNSYNENNPDAQIKSLDDLTNKYDAIKDLNLIKVPENNEEPEALEVIVPEVTLPMPGSSRRVLPTEATQEQYSTENKSVEILTQEEYDTAHAEAIQKAFEEMGGVPEKYKDSSLHGDTDGESPFPNILSDDKLEEFEAKIADAMNGKHTSVQNAIAAEYGLEVDSKGNIKDKDAFNAILFRLQMTPQMLIYLNTGQIMKVNLKQTA